MQTDSDKIQYIGCASDDALVIATKYTSGPNKDTTTCALYSRDAKKVLKTLPDSEFHTIIAQHSNERNLIKKGEKTIASKVLRTNLKSKL
jgi:hypothetical protein